MSQYFINDKNLKSNKIENKVSIKEIDFSFYTDNGLFHKKGLDKGTRILLENFDLANKQSFLDMGCGCGPIGIYIALLSKSNHVDMVDINKKAIKLTKESILLNEIKNAYVFVSDGYEKIHKKYDAILLNPPIHAGKKVIYKIIEDSQNHLNEMGELWIVIRKDHGAKSLIKDFYNIYKSEVICKDYGFWIIKFIK